MPAKRFLLAALFVLSLKPQAPAQSSTQTPQAVVQPSATLSIAAREVLLDVVVTDHDGRPITGLAPNDFTVVEDRDPQRLTHLEEHHPMSAEELARLKSMPQLPPNTFTNFTPVANTNSSTVILLDALDTPIERAQMQLRQQLIDYLKQMQPATPVAIFQLDIRMHLIQGMTADPAMLLDAAMSKRDMPLSFEADLRDARTIRPCPRRYSAQRLSAHGPLSGWIPGKEEPDLAHRLNSRPAPHRSVHPVLWRVV